MKKTLAAIALAGCIALIGSGPAVAATYPPLPPQATVSVGVVGPGETFVFSGQGFLAEETITIQMSLVSTPVAAGATVAGSRSVPARINVVTKNQTLKATADAQGAFSAPITVGEAGTYTITATGDISGITIGPVTVTVDASLAAPAGSADGTASPSNTGLAETGADSGLVLWSLVGAGALAAGAASIVIVRKRSKSGKAA